MWKRMISTNSDQISNKPGNYMDSESKERQTQTLRELWEAQRNNHACTQAARTIGLTNSMFTFDTEGAMAQVSTLDGASQGYFLATLEPRIFHQYSHSVLAVHCDERRMYDLI